MMQMQRDNGYTQYSGYSFNLYGLIVPSILVEYSQQQYKKPDIV
jgi:hypothetical protein